MKSKFERMTLGSSVSIERGCDNCWESTKKNQDQFFDSRVKIHKTS